MFSQEDLIQVARQTMPFGKYNGRILIDLPEEYLLWFSHKGWPNGNLGQWLQLALEIKINGLEQIVDPLREPTKKKADGPKVRISFDD
ncbi:hypothetical protein MUS1_03925 [Marinomonas ushuaiensis DSM 15871]|uniref:Cytoplasmic protein n=1 Tax=Marinomonas ushuaiensis DSM 15871 TaxID=1122207 RepID=X7E4V0_9GAMM|nr:DUF3820 family protein [Marinomonas ushuaiensis]ETX10206.1 hypothetical protein MUS1_03925 [Marinomonas ushuaiensis DSM 15871]